MPTRILIPNPGQAGPLAIGPQACTLPFHPPSMHTRNKQSVVGSNHVASVRSELAADIVFNEHGRMNVKEAIAFRFTVGLDEGLRSSSVMPSLRMTTRQWFSQDSNSRTVIKVDDPSSSSSKTGSTILIVCITLAAVAGLSFFLFKLWQKKKRDEQYARLLKLFEQDDELELELGLRD
ncbi:hypothetical protein Tco_0506354 [Tanacetum coccineum]